MLRWHVAVLTFTVCRCDAPVELKTACPGAGFNHDFTIISPYLFAPPRRLPDFHGALPPPLLLRRRLASASTVKLKPPGTYHCPTFHQFRERTKRMSPQINCHQNHVATGKATQVTNRAYASSTWISSSPICPYVGG